MKVGVLTQPLRSNYGGLLQAYALMTVLKRLGHDPIIVRRDFPLKEDWLTSVIFYLKQIVKLGLGREVNWFRQTSKMLNYVGQYTNLFVEEYIKTTEGLFSTSDLAADYVKAGYDAYVVGSDQVWRPGYSPLISNYFLDFLPTKNCCKTLRIAYAASFGGGEWQYSPQDTSVCASLAQSFDAISVREDSGVLLCREKLGVDAVHVLDPTMLLEQNDYVALVTKAEEDTSEGDMFCYILDQNARVDRFIQHVVRSSMLSPFSVMAKEKLNAQSAKHIQDCVFPSVTKWLRGFMDAKIVVTDSFHGCVFSIIFNKPFWVLGNSHRGQERFVSLLRDFGLEDRLVVGDQFKHIDVWQHIDWELVNRHKKERKKFSYDFLRHNLGK